MLFVQLTPTRDSTSELLDALRHCEVAVFGHITPGKTRTPNEGNGTPKRNIFLPKGESRIAPEQQKEQHSTSSTSQTPSAPGHPETLQLRVTLRLFTRWKA